jgi:NAD(P) transhydrogenase
MEQGRLAADHAFGEPTAGMLQLQPIGIYTVPEPTACSNFWCSPMT